MEEQKFSTQLCNRHFNGSGERQTNTKSVHVLPYYTVSSSFIIIIKNVFVLILHPPARGASGGLFPPHHALDSILSAISGRNDDSGGDGGTPDE
jgi:hypothetical protein